MLIGEMNENEKTEAIKQFSDPNSDVFIFLISTRSGSEGLNLTSKMKEKLIVLTIVLISEILCLSVI